MKADEAADACFSQRSVGSASFAVVELAGDALTMGIAPQGATRVKLEHEDGAAEIRIAQRLFGGLVPGADVGRSDFAETFYDARDDVIERLTTGDEGTDSLGYPDLFDDESEQPSVPGGAGGGE